MRFRRLPSQEVLIRILRYDPASGDFFWKVRDDVGANWNAKWAGRRAGTPGPKGTIIYVNWKPYPAHRLAWVYVHGRVPKGMQVDHADCDCFNNRITNLRIATHGQNASNSRGWKKKKLPKGVSIQTNGSGYRARIGVNGKVVHIGTFATAKEAHAAYCVAAKAAKGEFARAG